MSLNRGDLDGVAIVLLAVVGLAALVAVASTAPANPDPRAASVDLTDRLQAYSANEIPERFQLHPVGARPLVPLDSSPAGAAGAPGPAPTDAPFGPNVPVWTDARAQTRPSSATDSMGRIYVAFEHEVSPTNHDIYVSWSDNGGFTWSVPVGIAVTAADEVNPNFVVFSGDRLTVFIQQDANPGGFVYIYSTDRGSTWTSQTINNGGLPVTQFRYPSFVSNGLEVYGQYQVWCTDTSCLPGAWNVVFLWDDDASTAAGWFINWLAQTPSSEIFHPSTGFNPLTGDMVIVVELEIDDNIDWAATSARFNPTTGNFVQDRLVFPPSTTFGWPSISVSGNRIVWGNQIYNTTLLPYSIIVASYSTNGGTTYNFVSAGQGTIDTAAVDQKYVSFVIQGPQITTGYWKDGATWYVSSLNSGAAFQTPARVSDNTPATAIDQEHAVSVLNSSLGPVFTWHDSRDGNANIYATGFQRFAITIATSPSPGLNVRFDGGAWSVAPYTLSFPAGTPHTIEAQTPQGPGGGVRYVFVQWDDGNTQNPRPITVTADRTYTAQFRTQYEITVASNPLNRDVTVGGVTQTAPILTWCDEGASLAVDVPSPQTVSPTSRYRYQSWSDGGAQAHSVSCDGPRTVTATFVLQFLVNVRTNAPGNPTLQVTVNGVTYTAPVQFWFDQNVGVNLEAITPQSLSADTRVAFTDWQGGPTNTAWSVVITGATDYVANYKLQYLVTLDTNPPGLQVVVEGVPGTAPVGVWWDAGTPHNVLVNSPQFSGTTTQYLFSAWSDGDVNPSRSVTADRPKTLIAIFQTQYFLTMNTVPPGVGTLNPGNGWHNAGEPVPIQATPPADTLSDRYRFDRWTGDATGTANPTTVTMDAPKTVTANFFHQYRIDIRVASGGPSAGVSVDGGASQPMPVTAWWNEGSSHTIQAEPNILIGADTRWNFASWNLGGTNNPITVLVAGSGQYEVTYSQQFRVTIVTSPSSGPVVLVGTSRTPYTVPVWVDANTALALDADDGQSPSDGTRYVFMSWSDSSTAGAVRAITMNQGLTLTVTYEMQYRLTVTSSYGNPVCTGAKEQPAADQCWYTAGGSATVTVTSPVTAGGQSYTLESWSGAATGTSASVTFVMDAPKTLTAAWHQVTFLEAYGVMLGLVIVIIVAAILVALLLMRRRKKQEPEAVPPPPPATAGTKAPPAQGGTKTCGACGMEIPAGATTCPVCGAPA